MTDLNTIIGENLKLLRNRRGLTLDQVAELTSMSKSMIGQRKGEFGTYSDNSVEGLRRSESLLLLTDGTP